MTSPLITEASTVLNILLDQAQQCLIDAGRAVPEHVYVTHNAPAWDCCDLLAVHIDRAKPTDKFPRPAHYHPIQGRVRWAIDVVVTILRCVPTFDGTSLPSFDSLDKSGEDLADDAWAIYHGFGCKGARGTLLTNCTCDLVALGPLRPVGPQGGCGGYNFTVSVEPPGAV